MKPQIHPNPEPSPSETVETYMYKLASFWDIQLKYVIILRSSLLHPKYINLVALVRTLLEPGTEIDPVYDYVNKHTGRGRSNDVLSILIYCQASDLRIVDITKLGEGGETADIMNALLIRINEFCRRRNISSFTLAQMQNLYATHIREDAASLSITREKLRLLNITQERYLSAVSRDVLRASELEVATENLHLIVKEDLIKEDILTIFDNARISTVLQHVVCYSGVRMFQKIYKPGPFNSPVKRSAIINVTTSIPQGVLLFTISLSQVYQVKYTIESGVIETSARPKDKKNLLAAIRTGFPMLDFEVRTQEIEYRFNLYPTEEMSFEIPFHFLLHRTVTESHLFQFYLNESTTSFPEKNKFRFIYKAFWEGSRTGGTRDESTFVLSTPRMANDTNYIAVSITSGSEDSIREVLTSLVPAICVFFIEDIQNESPLSELYNIPNLIIKSHKPGSKLRDELEDKWPEVFTPNYLNSKDNPARSLVRITTDEEEAERWKKDVIIHELTRYDRQVLPFPPEAEEGTTEVMFWFTSVRPEAHHIGYKYNEYDDSPKYPLVPFSSAAVGVQKIRGISGGNVVSLAAQGEGLYAEAPDIIGHILGFETRRRGVAFGPNSIIRALLDTVDEFSDVPPASSEEEILSVRGLLANKEPELYKQQLYDLSYDEIQFKLNEYGTGRDEYFDPLIYSAGLEDLFQMDIYYIKAKIVQNVRTMTLELPRYSHFYCARRERRQCVVILINSGVRSDRLKWPHCELIVPKDSNIPLYSVEISSRLAEVREQCHKFLICSSGRVYNGAYMSSGMNEVLKVFSEVVSQYVDPNGKARAFTVRDDGDLITIFCYPCAPLSLPHSTEVHSAPDAEWMEDLCDSAVLGRSDLGAWCKHTKTSEVLYARLSFVPEEVPIIGRDPLTSLTQGEDVAKFTSSMSAKDRLALVLKEVLIWALDVSGLSARKFIRRYLTYSTEEEDEDTYYDVSTVGRRIPSVRNMTEVLSYLSNVIPTEEDIMWLHNKAFYLSMVDVLTRHPLTKYAGGIRYIKDYYKSISDFRSDKNTFILTGQVDPLTSIVNSLNKYAIVDQISAIGRLPVFYMQGNILWIIQSTHLKEVKCAYNICDTWRKRKINIGYSASPIKDITIGVLLYNVVAGRLVPVGKLKGSSKVKEEDYYEIVELGANNYAAMLRAAEDRRR